MKHSETCRCGASVDVEDDQRADVERRVDEWRQRHRCLDPGQDAPGDPRPNGVGCAVIGFHTQWDHDDERSGGVTARYLPDIH